MPNYDIKDPDSEMYNANIEDIENAYIIKNISLENILFNRNLIGLQFTENCELATYNYFRHFLPEIDSLEDNFAELIILTKGIYYWGHNAFAKAFNKNLQANFIYTSRDQVSEEGVKVVVRASNFDAPVKHLFIGDTIASGETICVALNEYLKYHDLEHVYIFSIVGSKIGGQKIYIFCKRKKIKLTIGYGLAAFGLAPNGFDLSFLHPDTITSEEYIEKAIVVYKGKPVSSAGWDFGTQAQATKKYKMLCWTEEKYWKLENSGVFKETKQPTDLRLIEKEYAAFNDKIPNL